MAYYERVIQPGESLHYLGRLHWIIYCAGLSFIGLAILLFIVAATGLALQATGFMVVLGIASAFVGFLSIFSAWIRRVSTEIAVTNRRVIFKVGLIRRRTVEMNISKIETVDVEQGILGRVLGFGTVLIRGTGAGFEPLRRVAAPLALRNAILVG